MAEEKDKMSESMNVQELQEHLGVSRPTLYRYFNNGLKSYWRNGRRARLEDVEKFKRENPTLQVRQKLG
jgi:predicted site-specific integrase-resolvase